MVDEKEISPQKDLDDQDTGVMEEVTEPVALAAPKGKGGRGPLVALLILGAVIVGGYFSWPALQSLLVAQMRSEAPKTMEAIKQLDHRMAQLEAANSKYDGAIAAMKASLNDLSGQLDGLAKAMPGGEMLAALGEKLNNLENDLTQLAHQLAQKAGESGTVATGMLDMLSQELENLKTRLSDMTGSQGDAGEQAKQSEDTAKLLAENAQLQETVTALQSRLDLLEASVRENAQARRSAGLGEGLVLAIGQLRQTVLAGQPYRAPLAAVAALAADNEILTTAITTLARSAEQGVATQRALSDQFPSVARAVLRADKSKGDSFLARTWQRMSALVTVRRVGEVEGPETDAVLARAERRLASDDLGAAVKIMDGLAGPAGDAARAWLDRAKTRLGAEGALAEMQSQAIAGLGDG